MRKQTILWATMVAATFGQSIRINEIQVIGTHNSYHAGLGPNEMAFLRKENPRAAESLDYSHPPLTDQLNAGVRQLEIDVFGDAKGGLFADPAWPGLLRKAGLALDPPFDAAGVMRKPGFKVLHVQDLDYRSRCQPFTACLEEVRAWSKAHPRHLPVFILIENKDGRPRPEYMIEPEALTSDTFDRLDAEIRSVFRAGEVITPDSVRGSFATLEEAVLRQGWPTVEAARGKVMFMLDQERVTPLVTANGHAGLVGRMMFTNSKPGTPDGAFVKLNNPASDKIAEVVRKGYMVRTMTDGGTAAVRAGDTKKRDAALESGAQMLSTDYPFDWKAKGSGYSVRFDAPAANVRCNPVLKAAACRLELLAEPAAQ